MQIIGTHTIKIFDRKNDLIHEESKSNIITNKGRERIIDIWAHNLNPNASRDRGLYGIERVDTNPTETPYGTRKMSLFDIGLTLDPRDNSGSRNFADRDYILTRNNEYSHDEIDRIFNMNNDYAFRSDVGTGSNTDMHDQWHCVDLARIHTKETFVVDTATSDHVIDLAGSNLKYDYNADKKYSLTVWNAGETASFAINTDYTFDRASGVLTIKQGSNIPDTSTIVVEYRWHDKSLFDTGFVGIYMKSWPDFWEESQHHRNYFAMGRMSVTGGETWEHSSMPWHGRPHNPWWSYYHEGDDYLGSPQMMDGFSHNNHEHWYLTYPYILNSPTNFAFMANFSHGGYTIQNMNFFKPVFNPQTPRVLALGTGDTTPSVDDTELDSEAFRFDVLATDRPSNGVGKWTTYLDYEQYSGVTFKEVGLFFGNQNKMSEDPGWTTVTPVQKENCNELFSRTLYDTPWSKTDEQRVELTYEITLV